MARIATSVYHSAVIIWYTVIYTKTSRFLLNEQMRKEHIVNLDPTLLFSKEDSWITYYFDTYFYEQQSRIF